VSESECAECGSYLDRDPCPVCEGEPIERATNWVCGECDGTGTVPVCVVCRRAARQQRQAEKAEVQGND